MSRVRQGIANYYGELDRLLYRALEEFPFYRKDVVVLGSQRYVRTPLQMKSVSIELLTLSV